MQGFREQAHQISVSDLSLVRGRHQKRVINGAAFEQGKVCQNALRAPRDPDAHACPWQCNHLLWDILQSCGALAGLEDRHGWAHSQVLSRYGAFPL